MLPSLPGSHAHHRFGMFLEGGLFVGPSPSLLHSEAPGSAEERAGISHTQNPAHTTTSEGAVVITQASTPLIFLADVGSSRAPLPAWQSQRPVLEGLAVLPAPQGPFPSIPC